MKSLLFVILTWLYQPRKQSQPAYKACFSALVFRATKTRISQRREAVLKKCPFVLLTLCAWIINFSAPAGISILCCTARSLSKQPQSGWFLTYAYKIISRWRPLCLHRRYGRELIDIAGLPRNARSAKSALAVPLGRRVLGIFYEILVEVAVAKSHSWSWQKRRWPFLQCAYLSDKPQ